MRKGDRAFGGKARGSRSWCTSKIGPTPGGPDFRSRAGFPPKTARPLPCRHARNTGRYGPLINRCHNPRAKIGNNFTNPSDITSTASAAKISPINRVITLIPVLPKNRAIGWAAAKHNTVARATTRP